MSGFPENSRDRPFSFGASFNTAAQWTSRQCGRASTFALAWSPSFPTLGSHQHGHNNCDFPDGVSDPNTKNRDTTALHLKLDELIHVSENARNKLLDLEVRTPQRELYQACRRCA
jgi:low affinity Fe/Cu permease